MARVWPAIDVSIAVAGDPDLILAAADDYSPTAVEERDGALRIFFSTSGARDRAAQALGGASVDVDDQDWARKQQLDPVTVGSITVLPEPRVPSPESPISIVIPPSMGFGTGHHATTRLCLAELQKLDLAGKFVLDVGTGSGLLAIAAAKLGAARALGTDDDPDAIQAARENLDLNHVTNVELVVADLMNDALPPADVVVANLVGALIVRAASRLTRSVAPGGVLVLSGILATERQDVTQAVANLGPASVVQEDEWLAITIQS